jgi:hypothetical protein
MNNSLTYLFFNGADNYEHFASMEEIIRSDENLKNSVIDNYLSVKDCLYKQNGICVHLHQEVWGRLK